MLYIAPIFVFGMRFFGNARVKLLEGIGKASYHILMVQILYFNFLAPLVWTAPKNVIPNDAVGFILSAGICLGGGYGYYRLYNYFMAKNKKKRHV